jgi:hypothetical protein
MRQGTLAEMVPCQLIMNIPQDTNMYSSLRRFTEEVGSNEKTSDLIKKMVGSSLDQDTD